MTPDRIALVHSLYWLCFLCFLKDQFYTMMWEGNVYVGDSIFWPVDVFFFLS